MPRNISINFRDPRNGVSHKLEGKSVDSAVNKGPRAAEKLQAKAGDGMLDLFVREEKSSGRTTHMRLALTDLDPGVAEALQAAIRGGSKDAFSLAAATKALPRFLCAVMWPLNWLMPWATVRCGTRPNRSPTTSPYPKKERCV